MQRRLGSPLKSMMRAAAVAAWCATSSLAQTTVPPSALEFEDAEIFRPATDSGDLITVYDSTPQPPLHFSLGFYGDYARHPLEIAFQRSGNTFTRLVNNLGTMQLVSAVGLLPWFEVGARLPGYVETLNDVSSGTQAVRGGAIAKFGDMVANAKITLLPISRHGIGIAILPEITLPTGSRTDFAGTGKLGYGGLFIVDGAPTDRLHLSLNLGGLIRDKPGGGPLVDSSDDLNDQFRYGAGAAYAFNDRLSGIAELYGAADTHKPFDAERKTPLDFVAGLRWHLGLVDLTLGGGPGLTIGQGSPNFRIFVGVTPPRPGPPTRGADLAQSRKTYNVEDLDRDGRPSPGDVLEYTIHLVNTGTAPAEDVHLEDPIPDHTAYVPGSLAIDGHAVTDSPGDDPGEFVPGPPPAILVRIAKLDPLPAKNEVTVTFRAAVDKEITSLTTIVNQAYVSATGIPKRPLPPTETTIFPAITEREHVIVGPEKIELTKDIHFEFDRADIRRESYPILKELASVLQQYPQLRIRIEGHTDAVGTESYNQRLSELRAKSVRDFLIGLGIDKSRLDTAGRGETSPIATNDTATGRAMNRRTEFLVLNPDALKGVNIQRELFKQDLAPQSEPEWLKEKGFHEKAGEQ